MKKLFVIVSLLLVTTVMLFGCGKTDNSTLTQQLLPPQEYNKTFTLQGKIMDAVTGAAIGSDPVDPAGALQMFLIQGDADREPTKLHSDPNDPLVGEYSISGIPADVNVVTSETVFKVIVKRKGYQDFSAYVKFDAKDLNASFDNNGTLNKIGNIYLFPIGSVPGTVHVHVVSVHLIPVPGVTVLLQQDVFNNEAIAITSSDNFVDTNRLPAAGGLYTSMSAVTDADGVATFSGADLPLVLGGKYKAVAKAIEFQGDELKTSFSGAFIIGKDTLHQHITMGSAGLSFFATSASNQVPGTIDPTGTLTVAFNQPVVMSTTRCDATLSNTLSGIITVGTNTFGDGAPAPILGTLAADGLSFTITIKDNLTTAPSTTSKGAAVTYSNCGTLILKDSQTPAGVTLFGTLQSVTTGTVVSGKVQLNSF